MIKFFKLPKYATIKCLLTAAFLQGIFGMVLINFYNQSGSDWRVLAFSYWSSFVTIFGGVIFLSLGVIAYWFPRSASLLSVCIYASLIVDLAILGNGVLKKTFICTIPMVILLLFALAGAFRQTSLFSQLPSGEGIK